MKVDNAYSSWNEIHNPWSTSFQYLFVLCDLFYFTEGVALASYDNDTTPYSANKTNDLVIKEREDCSEVLFEWFDK